MLKSQILSFGYIGASMTIIVAFFVNYICSLGYEIIFFGDYPTTQQMFGCLLIFAGVYLYKNQLKTNQTPQQDYKASEDPAALADIELQIVEGRSRPSDKKFVVRPNDQFSPNSSHTNGNLITSEAGNFFSPRIPLADINIIYHIFGADTETASENFTGLNIANSKLLTLAELTRFHKNNYSDKNY